MAKLTDTQTILLSSASQRSDGSLLPLPETLGAISDRLGKAIAALIKRSYADEVPVTAADHAWRVDGDQRFGAVINDAGRVAIGVEPETARQEQPRKPAPTGGAGRRTKGSLVLSLLQREQGATLAELVEATGWLPHTTRAALTGLRKKGHQVAKEKVDGTTRYRIAAAA